MGKYFGTDGVRGIAGDTLTSGTAYRIGRFIGQYPNGAKNKILIGQDTRKSGFMLYSSLSGGITSSGGDVFNLGVTTSPSISYLVKNGGFDYGIMITASHNPFYDNGIKIFSPEGEKIKSSVEDLIEYYIDFGNQNNEIPNMSGADIGIITYAFELRKKYVKFLKNHAKVYPNYNILVDCGNGSASDIAPEIFSKEIGINATFINNEPNGININKLCGAAHIACLQEEILKEKGKYDFGLAFDGDADRLMIVDGEGNIVDGDKIIYLCAKNMITENRLPDNTVVITVMTNFGVKKAFKEAGINYFETQVGDRFVQAKMKASGYMLGGEQSGHVIFLDDLNTGDGILSALEVMNVLLKTGKTFKELLKDVTTYPQVLKNISVSNKEFIMNNQTLKDAIQEEEGLLDGDGRILVRPSGTENLIRVMAEAKTVELAEETVDRVVALIGDMI